MIADPAPGTEVLPRLNELVKRLIDVANQLGRPELTARLIDEGARWRAQRTTVVVVGQVKTGKSSLLNALLGTPSLLPVDADITTAVHVVVQHAPAPTARVLRDDGAWQPIPVDQVVEWATVAGNPGNRKRVRAVELGVNHSLLAAGLVFVDTPGVGGLDSAHAQITLEVLRRADALMFLTEASGELTGPEIHFLERATERIDTVMLLLAQIDKHHSWKGILTRDEELLTVHAPRYANAPLIPVSSRLKQEADGIATDDPQSAEELFTESGFGPLESWLRGLVNRARTIRITNALYLVKIVAAALEVPERAAAAAADGDPSIVEVLQAEQERLRTFSDARAEWGMLLSDRFQVLGLDLTVELHRETSALQRKYDALIAAAKHGELQTIADDLDADLQALAARLSATLQDRIGETVDELADALSVDVPFALEHVTSLESIRDRVDPVTETDDGRLKGFRSIYMSASIGRGAAGVLVSLASLIGFTGAPVALLFVAAGGAVAVFARSYSRKEQQRVRDRQEARAAVKAALEYANREIAPQLNQTLVHVRGEIQRELRRRLNERELELRQALTEHTKTVQGDQAAQQRRKAEATERLMTLQELSRRADELLNGLPATPTPAHPVMQR